MDSWVMREVTRLRRRDCRCAEVRKRVRYFMCPPAMVVGEMGEVVDVGRLSVVEWVLGGLDGRY